MSAIATVAVARRYRFAMTIEVVVVVAAAVMPFRSDWLELEPESQLAREQVHLLPKEFFSAPIFAKINSKLLLFKQGLGQIQQVEL